MLIAAIWGSGFVAQRMGMELLGPYSFNVGRFVLATLSLLPLWWFVRRRESPAALASDPRMFWWGGILAGSLMFAGFSFQQVGLQYTTAGNAGFITSIYIVIVPLFGLAVGQATRRNTWIGIALAVAGLYKLSIGPDFHINKGDWIELIGAFFWAGHVVTLGWLSRRVKDLVGISVIQFMVASLWAIGMMQMMETPQLSDFTATLLPLLYSGLIVSGLAFTLQIIAQKTVNSSTAALILSGEAVFALLAGWLFLGEQVGSQELIGCSLMLAGLLVSQWPEKSGKSDESENSDQLKPNQ